MYTHTMRAHTHSQVCTFFLLSTRHLLFVLCDFYSRFFFFDFHANSVFALSIKLFIRCVWRQFFLLDTRSTNHTIHWFVFLVWSRTVGSSSTALLFYTPIDDWTQRKWNEWIDFEWFVAASTRFLLCYFYLKQNNTSKNWMNCDFQGSENAFTFVAYEISEQWMTGSCLIPFRLSTIALWSQKSCNLSQIGTEYWNRKKTIGVWKRKTKENEGQNPMKELQKELKSNRMALHLYACSVNRAQQRL